MPTRRRRAVSENSLLTDEEQRIYKDVVKQARSMQDEFLLCRAGGHAFTVPLTARKTRGTYEERYACRNDCGVERFRILNGWGMVIKSNLDYTKAKGYLLQGTGRLTGFAKGALRVENVERTIERLKVGA